MGPTGAPGLFRTLRDSVATHLRTLVTDIEPLIIAKSAGDIRVQGEGNDLRCLRDFTC